MKNIWHLAVVSYKDSVRKRILWVFLIFSLILIVFAVAMEVMSLERSSVFDKTAGLEATGAEATEEKMAKDMGIASIAIFAVLILLFTASSQIPEEVEGRTLYTLLTFPIRRRHYILGKFLGQLLVVLTIVPAMAVILYVALFLKYGTLDAVMLKGIYALVLQLAVLASVSVMVSTFAPVNFNIIFCFILFLAGHTTGYIGTAARETSVLPAKWGLTLLYTVIPNFEYFNLSSELALKTNVSFPYLLSVSLYALVYIASMLTIAAAVFRDRQV